MPGKWVAKQSNLNLQLDMEAGSRGPCNLEGGGPREQGPVVPQVPKHQDQGVWADQG